LVLWAGALKEGDPLYVYMVLWEGDLKERDHLNDVGIDGRIILEWILKM
jgi:hypothetical protein